MQTSNSMPEYATSPLDIVMEIAQLHDASRSLLITASQAAKEQGHTYEQIGKASGVSTTQAWRRVNGVAA
jgi:hypothetical protein